MGLLCRTRLKWQAEQLSWMAVFYGRAILGMVARRRFKASGEKGLKWKDKESSVVVRRKKKLKRALFDNCSIVIKINNIKVYGYNNNFSNICGGSILQDVNLMS
ncbi:hypothetical protein CDAR_172801 [Caerostris darwini]|uniref:Uncharacterized protein n=1 Tax=Caerostris darwini TaxID=1538125 RepID=A0AAV4UYE9_9ARAC|nr:hypothetical protein CDAR_172801 [Caerostris darwini]